MIEKKATCIYLSHSNAEAVGLFFLSLSLLFSLPFSPFLFITFRCAVDFPLYWQRAGIKEYQFTYTVLIKCNKIPPKDIINVLFLL